MTSGYEMNMKKGINVIHLDWVRIWQVIPGCGSNHLRISNLLSHYCTNNYQTKIDLHLSETPAQ